MIKCHESFHVEIMYKTTRYHVRVYVADVTNNLLGHGAAQQMNLVKLNLSEVLQPFSKLKGPLTHITLQEDSTPYSVRAPQRVPFPLMEPLKEMLEKMEAMDIIVKQTEPTDWCAPIVVASKKTSEICVCVDLCHLNCSVKHERYVIPTFTDIAPKLKDCKIFSKLDAKSGYHQLPLDEESSLLTTFRTPYGCFWFRRLPFGITSVSEIFQRRMSELLEGLDGVAVTQDDVIICGVNLEEHDRRLNKVLAILKRAGLELNKSKCLLRVSQIEFIGYVFSGDGIAADPEKVAAIVKMKAPTDKTKLRRFLSMANWLGAYVPHMATIAEPLNVLLKDCTVWTWDQEQQVAFEEVKQLLITSPILTYYNPSKETTVAADASSYEIGAVLLQSHNGKLMPIAYASCSLTDCERLSAQIEKELLSLTWAFEKFRRYLIGLPKIKLITDHKPLIPIINQKDLDDVPIRCQRMLMRLMQFNCLTEYLPGKSLTMPDILTHSPLPCEAQDICEISEFVSYVPASDVMIRKFQQATAEDMLLLRAIDCTVKGWPKYTSNVPDELKQLYGEQAHLSVSQGLLLYRRIVIPQSMQSEVLQEIHEGHMGVTKCRKCAQQTACWKGINNDIQNTVESCQHCQIHKSAQRHEPMIGTPLPSGPWLKIGADQLTFEGKEYMVITDYYSRWIEIIYMGHDTTAKTTITKFKNVFVHWGIPQEVITDNGPQFRNEFKAFADECGFIATTSSPKHPQSDGAAEKSVNIAKHILSQESPMSALMEYRATPTAPTGFSPAMLMMGRNIQQLCPPPVATLSPGGHRTNQSMNTMMYIRPGMNIITTSDMG